MVFTSKKEVRGLKIKELRKRAGLTQQELADKALVTRSQISRYENGKRYPDLPNLIRIKCAIGCTLDELVGPSSEDGTIQ